MQDPTEILWKISVNLEKAKPVSSLVGWQLRGGIKIFGPKTKAKCPNCETWIETNRIWLVDESKGYLKGCWHLDGSKVSGKSTDIIHPHVPYNGQVCLGDSGGASNALFCGVASGKHYHSTEKWFSQLGHDCVNAIRGKCSGCDYEGFQSELEDGRVCNECINGGTYSMCGNCENWCPTDEMDGNGYCSSCAEELHHCRHCNEREVEEDGDICDNCVCRESTCTSEIHENSRYYCSDHFYQCSCECECTTRLSEEDERCEWCQVNCNTDEEEEEETHTYPCSCPCTCSGEVKEEGQKCGPCTDLETTPLPFMEDNLEGEPTE